MDLNLQTYVWLPFCIVRALCSGVGIYVAPNREQKFKHVPISKEEVIRLSCIRDKHTYIRLPNGTVRVVPKVFLVNHSISRQPWVVKDYQFEYCKETPQNLVLIRGVAVFSRFHGHCIHSISTLTTGAYSFRPRHRNGPLKVLFSFKSPPSMLPFHLRHSPPVLAKKKSWSL